jgi:S1-C subfamily serine protease
LLNLVADLGVSIKNKFTKWFQCLPITPRSFQISVPVQPGNSGGALVDVRVAAGECELRGEKF